jgi:hypothetical protein
MKFPKVENPTKAQIEHLGPLVPILPDNQSPSGLSHHCPHCSGLVSLQTLFARVCLHHVEKNRALQATMDSFLKRQPDCPPCVCLAGVGPGTASSLPDTW